MHIFPLFFNAFMLPMFRVVFATLTRRQVTVRNMLRPRALVFTNCACAWLLARPVSGQIPSLRFDVEHMSRVPLLLGLVLQNELCVKSGARRRPVPS